MSFLQHDSRGKLAAIELAVSLASLKHQAANHGDRQMQDVCWDQREVDDGDLTLGCLICADVVAKPISKRAALVRAHYRGKSRIVQHRLDAGQECWEILGALCVVLTS